MNYDDIQILGSDVFDVVVKRSEEIGLQASSPLLYCLVHIYGSLNYAPDRANDCDIRITIPPHLDDELPSDLLEGCTYKGLPIDVKVGSIGSMNIDELIELSSIFDDEQKVYFIAKKAIKTQMMPTKEMFKSSIKRELAKKPYVRVNISKKCSNSFVKAKKKLLVQKDYDPYISMKSLWHSIRIYDFASQYAKNGRIVDFDSCSELWNEIADDYASHDVDELIELIKTKYKKKQNRAASVFKIYYPK